MISIDRIEIKNFRQYRKAELSFDRKTGSYFFVGKNGIGKSNFMNAICWCLYGRMPFRSDSDKTSTPKNIVNTDAQKDGEKEVEVKIVATIADKTYLISRNSTSNLILNPYLKNQSNFNVFEIVDSGLVPQNNPELTIDRLLPFDLSNLFIFDGEVIKNLFDGDYSEHLKNQVYKVSNIDLLRRSKDDINKVIKQYEKQRKTAANNQLDKTQLEQLIAQNEDLAKQYDDEISQLTSERKEIVAKRDALNEALRKHRDAQDLVNESESLDKEIKDLINRKKLKQKQINQTIQKIAPFAIMGDRIKDYLEAINGAVKRKELPPSILPEELEHICNTNVCICKRELDEESRKAIKAMLEESQRTNELSFLRDHTYGCSQKIRSFSSILKDLNTMEEELNDYEKKREIKEKRLEVVVNEIKSTGAYARVIQQNPKMELDTINTALSKIDGDIAIKTRDKEACDAQISQATQDLDKLVDNSKENKIIHAKIIRLESIRRTVEAVERKILDDTRLKIEQGTTQTYKHLHWKEEINKVVLSEDYVLSIQKTSGDTTQLSDLSNGEKKMLGISVINALSKKIKNFDFPFFIDSPTEELDTSVVPTVLENLQSLSTDKQVFIMTLNKPEVAEFLKKIPDEREYSLARVEGSIETTAIRRRGL